MENNVDSSNPEKEATDLEVKDYRTDWTPLETLGLVVTGIFYVAVLFLFVLSVLGKPIPFM
jgi:hypothetical protein